MPESPTSPLRGNPHEAVVRLPRGAALRAGSSRPTTSPAGRRGWRRSSTSCAPAPRRSPPAAASGRSSGIGRAASCSRGSGSTGWSTRHGVPGAERARRLGALRRPGAERGDRHRDRRRRGARVRDRRERRDREGRLLLPADGEEAPARAGGGRAEPAAVPLPRRLGRRVPAAAGGGLPRPRPLRPHLLQPGAHVGAGDPADRRRDGLVHRRRRLRARR